jgi:hypothetical protein
MPCGGIYPASGHWTEHPCWVCCKRGCDLFCDEWDTPIHSRCVPEFLRGGEGKIVLAHGHGVVIMKKGKRVVLHEGEG